MHLLWSYNIVIHIRNKLCKIIQISVVLYQWYTFILPIFFIKQVTNLLSHRLLSVSLCINKYEWLVCIPSFTKYAWWCWYARCKGITRIHTLRMGESRWLQENNTWITKDSITPWLKYVLLSKYVPLLQ